MRGKHKTMEIAFTKEQYESLLKLVYWGNWMINSARTDDYVKNYEDLEDYILSFATIPGLDKYIEHDEKSERYYPSLALGEHVEIEQYIDDYNDDFLG